MREKRFPPPSFWAKVPVDPEFDQWLTVRFSHRVLVVVRTVTTLTRLLDVVSLLKDDPRIQIVFTHNEREPAILSSGVGEFLASLDAKVISWEQAVETRFDLAIAASENDELHRVNAPVLLVPHGIGHQKHYPHQTVISGLNPARLVRDGHVVLSRIGLSHSNQLRYLRRNCPQAEPHAVVVGDPCHDRMLASLNRAARYRRLLDVRDRKHVVLASTWGPDSLLGTDPGLPARLLTELPVDEYKFSLIAHPGAWAAHSPWQLRAWLSRARRAGLAVIPPQRGWQAAVVSADCLVSDGGSIALYAAAARIPVLIGSREPATVVPDSPLAELLARAPRLDQERDLREQVDQACAEGPLTEVAAQAVEFSGKCAELLRPVLYDLMRLTEPDTRAVFLPVPDPVPEVTEPATFSVEVRQHADHLTVSRFPTEQAGRSGSSDRHVVAHEELSTLDELEGAAVVYCEFTGEDAEFDGWAREIAHRRPDAGLIAGIGAERCLVWSAGEPVVELTTRGEPLATISAYYWRRNRNFPATGSFRVREGHHVRNVVASMFTG
ncbi:hypothetical protein [Amycolatopsis keratiniphila]|uniref:CDP-Glycerol:Poly(Glycerophosphate) glycerophosphotransferase n=1 Tax=Amycolatopsis keratiniphila TaxID=129921 RepID=R4SW54_9PSEU|nr:hypothetical protein [Amycolatopsis keratiniphila]AGM02758.1 hypothetical protein AORI_0169 [Amycolatopsis keratiniphila]